MMITLNPLHEGRSQIYRRRLGFVLHCSQRNTTDKILERLLQGVEVLEGI